MALHRWYVLLLLAGCATGATASRPGPPPAVPASPPSAADVLDAMAKRYADATTYADRGTVTTVYKGSRPTTDTLTFETAFVRNQRLRFEYRKARTFGSERYVIWSDFVHTYSEWTVRPGITDDGRDAGMPLAAAAGVSGGSSLNITSMLLPERFGRSFLLQLESPTLEGSESIGGHTCWRIRGTTRMGDPLTLWIDTGSKLLRRIRSSHHFADFDSEDTTDFEPTLGQPVDIASLKSPDVTANPPVVRQPAPPPRMIGVMFDGKTPTIRSVVRNSPAERAGLRVGDTIVAVNDKPVVRPVEVSIGVWDAAVGTSVRLTIMRAGTKSDVSVTPETAKDPRRVIRDQLLDQHAPAFDLTVVVGSGSAKLADLAGNVVVLDFWSASCQPCRRQVPHLNDLARKHSALRVIGISSDELDDIRQYAKDNNVTYTLASDPDDGAWTAYWGTAYPTLVVIDKAGIVRHVEVGAGDTSELDAAIERLLR